MSHNQTNVYSVDPHQAEIYDQLDHSPQDIELLLSLIGDRGPWDIFEPFCGTGRILIPLARAGHRLTGLDQSAVLLGAAREKLAREKLACEKLQRAGLEATLIEGDVITDPWPTGFDLVVMGGNCLYELATPAEQEHCISTAAAALKPGGYLFLDNDHMEGELAQGWRNPAPMPAFPSGLCADGVRLESTMQTVWFDGPARLARFRRTTRVILPDGTTTETSLIQQKHPVSAGEVRGWLEKYGFAVEHGFGTRTREPYTDASPRAIFWARKTL